MPSVSSPPAESQPFVWHFGAGTSKPEASPALLQAILGTFRDGFAMEGWSPEGIALTLERSDALGLLKDSNNEIYGYAFYIAPAALLLGKSLLWEEAICLRKAAHGRGLSKLALEQALSSFPDRQIGWIGGRTQNPIIMRRYLELGPTYPLDLSYAEEEGPTVADFLIEHIPEVGEVESYEREKGLCIGAYRRRVMGDHSWDPSGELEKRVTAMGFERTRGDALAIVAKIALAND